MFSFHVDPDLPVRTVCVREGLATVGAEDFVFDFIGRSSHLSRPHEGVNPVWDAFEALQTIKLERDIMFEQVKSGEYLRLDVSQIGAGLDPTQPFAAEVNTLPSHCRVSGSVRVLGDALQKRVVRMLENIRHAALWRHHPERKMERSDAFDCVLKMTKYAVPTSNDPAVVLRAVVAIAQCGFTRSNDVKHWKDAAGWTSLRAPVCHGYVGCGIAAGKLHTGTFYPPDEVLPIGLELFLRCLS